MKKCLILKDAMKPQKGKCSRRVVKEEEVQRTHCYQLLVCFLIRAPDFHHLVQTVIAMGWLYAMLDGGGAL